MLACGPPARRMVAVLHAWPIRSQVVAWAMARLGRCFPSCPCELRTERLRARRPVNKRILKRVVV
eukprot:6176441-Pleurochrysis_carterae.AAC.1